MFEWVKSWNVSDLLWVNALILLGVYIVAAIVIDIIYSKLLKKLTKFTKNDLDDKIIEFTHKPIFISILFAGITSALGGFEIPENILNNINKAIYTLLVIIWTVSLIRLAREIITRFINKLFDITGLSKDIIPLIASITNIAIVIAAGMAVLAIWHIDITPLVASAGILSAVIAFAAKDTFANFFGGVSVFFDKPYKIGDYVELGEGERGEVVQIGIRSTRIKTRDDILISIPNSIIVNSKIINESQPVPKFRVRIPIGVAYGSDIDLVEDILLEITKNNENIVNDPEPRVRFREFGESSLNFELLCWAAEPSLRGLTVHHLNRAIYKIFAERGITIPFPQRDLHIMSDKPVHYLKQYDKDK